MMSTSGGLKLSAVAGGPSVIRLTHKSCTGIRASGIPSAAVRKMLQNDKERVNLEDKSFKHFVQTLAKCL